MRSHTLYTKLRHFLAEQRAMELRDLYKEVGTWSLGERSSQVGGGAPAPSSQVYSHNLISSKHL